MTAVHVDVELLPCSLLLPPHLVYHCALQLWSVNYIMYAQTLSYHPDS